MRRASEHGALGLDQAFNAVSGMVEATCQLRHLIAPLDLHAYGKVSGTECLNPCLEPFESSGDAPYNGVCPQRNGNGQQTKRPQQAEGAMPRLPARHHDPAIWEGQSHGWPSPSGTYPARRQALWRGGRQRRTDCSKENAVRTAHGEMDREQSPETRHRSLQLVNRSI